jgi:geranylgeranyl diphosphate synthase type II
MDLTAYLDECRNWVRDELQAMLPSDSSRTGGLYKLMLNYPLRYGKALRPALSIAICRARGGSLSAVLPTAAVLELYHNAFLIHDDCADQSEMRRSEPTLHRQYGLPIAVNVGDGMLAVAIQPLLDNIERVGLGKALKILRIVSRMARETAEGQMIELDWIRSENWIQDDSDYTRLVHKKSGWYTFIAPIMVGAVAAGLSDTEVTRLGRIAIPLGIAFQAQDDILNLSANSETYGKDSSGDLWEGKHTLILIHALRSATPNDRMEALSILRKPQRPSGHAGDAKREMEPKSQTDIEFLRRLIEHSESIPYTWARARTYAGRFKRDLDSVCKTWSHSVHRDFLHELAEFTINRTA